MIVVYFYNLINENEMKEKICILRSKCLSILCVFVMIFCVKKFCILLVRLVVLFNKV